MASQDLSSSNFNVLIAYLIPGITAIRGLPLRINGQNAWAVETYDPTIAGFALGFIEALFIGLTVSTFRWLLIDSLHRRMGIISPARNYSILERKAHAFEIIVAHQYAYYKFYANMIVALAWSFVTVGWKQGWFSIAYAFLAIVFYFGSRDTLKAYYERSGQLLKETQPHQKHQSVVAVSIVD